MTKAQRTGERAPRAGRKRTARNVRGQECLVSLAAAMLMSGCSLDSILKSDELPPDVTDPAITQTAEGALAAYRGTIVQFRSAFGRPGPGSYVPATGLFSDELWYIPDSGFEPLGLDMRDIPEGGVSLSVYSNLHRVRGQAGQSIGLLTRYAPGTEALRGHAYALQGYAEILLAEFFCSGIPLSTLDFEGDYTYKPGSSTEEVLTHAVALFDTALTLSADSTRFVHLAQVGRARALLSLGDPSGAAAAVAQVPDEYSYAVRYSTIGLDTTRNFATSVDLSVSDYEGVNGFDYRSSGDPRTRVILRRTDPLSGRQTWHATKYATDGSSPIVLASGVEARLIEAEAALRDGGGTWLEQLNVLRTDGTFTTEPNADDTTKTDTLWNAGTGGVAGLAPLADPMSDDARVDLLFRERAFWLFLTGHRQGDLRRLLRQYGRDAQDVYPVGVYPSRLTGLFYGSDVTVPVPSAERVSNPHFTGCASRGA